MACGVAELVLRRRFHELDGDKGRREYVFYGARGDNVWCMGAKVTPYEVERSCWSSEQLVYPFYI